ncbi:MAG: hypothetical protein EXR72_04045 [Myxococcales bacterium]|nr:hypothetical protein [Myxococcales bacterium]
MIQLTRFNRQPVMINAHAIACVESDPGTLVTLLNGDRIHVLEPVEEVVERALDFHRRIHAGDLARAPQAQG